MGMGEKIVQLIQKRQEKKRLSAAGEFGLFWRNGGNEQTVSNLPIVSESLVIDIGAYKGEWASEILSRYGCHIILFEPVPEFAKNLKGHFVSNKRVRVYDYALGDSDRHSEFVIKDNGSSLYAVKGSRLVDVRVRDINSVFAELKIDKVACLKMNIEGAEYEVLNSLIDSGTINCCDSLLIQFHKQPEGYNEKLKSIHNSLSLSYSLEWSYPFIWELWKRK